jgi:tetratricopeptide (TPR) repeat protein
MRTSYLLPFSFCLFFIFALGTRPSMAAALDRDQILSEATRLFQEASQLDDQGQSAELYHKALLRFEKLVQDGVVNGKLFYNLGNTYFQLHDLGRAVLNYRRAQLYLPSDDNLHQNLLSARGQQSDRIEPQQEVMLAKTFFFWHYDL